MKQILLFFIAFLVVNTISAQIFNAKSSVLGSNNDNRNWWNVLYYELKVNFDIPNQSIYCTPIEWWYQFFRCVL